MSACHLERARSVVTARLTAPLLLYAEATPAAPSVQIPTRPKSTPALFRFARRAPPAHTPQFAAPTVTHLTKPVIPTALRVSRYVKPPEKRMQSIWETPQKREWSIRWPFLHP